MPREIFATKSRLIRRGGRAVDYTSGGAVGANAAQLISPQGVIAPNNFTAVGFFYCSVLPGGNDYDIMGCTDDGFSAFAYMGPLVPPNNTFGVFSDAGGFTSAVVGTVPLNIWFALAIVSNSTTLTGYQLTFPNTFSSASCTGTTGTSTTTFRACLGRINGDNAMPFSVGRFKGWGYPMSAREVRTEFQQLAPVSQRKLVWDLPQRNAPSMKSDIVVPGRVWTLDAGTYSTKIVQPPVPEVHIRKSLFFLSSGAVAQNITATCGPSEAIAPTGLVLSASAMAGPSEVEGQGFVTPVIVDRAGPSEVLGPTGLVKTISTFAGPSEVEGALSSTQNATASAGPSEVIGPTGVALTVTDKAGPSEVLGPAGLVSTVSTFAGPSEVVEGTGGASNTISDKTGPSEVEGPTGLVSTISDKAGPSEVESPSGLVTNATDNIGPSEVIGAGLVGVAVTASAGPSEVLGAFSTTQNLTASAGPSEVEVEAGVSPTITDQAGPSEVEGASTLTLTVSDKAGPSEVIGASSQTTNVSANAGPSEVESATQTALVISDKAGPSEVIGPSGLVTNVSDRAGPSEVEASAGLAATIADRAGPSEVIGADTFAMTISAFLGPSEVEAATALIQFMTASAGPSEVEGASILESGASISAGAGPSEVLGAFSTVQFVSDFAGPSEVEGIGRVAGPDLNISDRAGPSEAFGEFSVVVGPAPPPPTPSKARKAPPRRSGGGAAGWAMPLPRELYRKVEVATEYQPEPLHKGPVADETATPTNQPSDESVIVGEPSQTEPLYSAPTKLTEQLHKGVDVPEATPWALSAPAATPAAPPGQQGQPLDKGSWLWALPVVAIVGGVALLRSRKPHRGPRDNPYEPPPEESKPRKPPVRTRTPPAHATIRENFIKCGKADCQTCPHGPYYYAYWRDEKTGKVKSMYLGKVKP